MAARKPAAPAKPVRPVAASGKRHAGVEQPDFPGLHSGLDLRPHKTLRLAVSGDVALNRLETRLTDTADFQRLRRIRQLGTACWVYPTALHTRFDHSLGTLAMASEMIRAMRSNVQHPEAWREVAPEEEQLARVFALLHDVTHVPFGHTIEDECALFTRHDDDPARIERFLGPEAELGRLLRGGLGGELHGRLMTLFRAAAGLGDDPGDDQFILDLVTGAIGADLLDYLRRDAFFCNLALDSDYRFLRHLAIVPHEGRRRLVLQLWKDGSAQPRRDVLNELVRLLDNRYLLGERVYFHHAKLVTGAMLADAVARAHRAGEISAADLCVMGDDVVLWKLGESADPAVRRLAGGLEARRLWKAACMLTYKSVAAEQQMHRATDIFADLMRRYHDAPAARLAEEDRIAGLLGMDPADLLIYCPHWKMAMKSATTLVFWNGAIRPLKDCGDDPLVGARLEAILASHQNLWAIRMFIHPARRGQIDAVAEACDALLTHEPARKARHERTFYTRVLGRRLAGLGEGEALSAGERDARIERALGELLRLPEARRTAEAADAALLGMPTA